MMTRIVTAGLMAAAAAFAVPGHAQDEVFRAPAAQLRETPTDARETAYFAGGCFWGVQGVFDHVKGVISTTAGYTGGAAATAHYDDVSTGTTGHAESVKVVFDPHQINYADLLRIYFSVITDPTEVDRQGPDTGPQYRTALFPVDAAQAKVARAYIGQLAAAHVYGKPIATRLEAEKGFYPAEGYHQQFMLKNPDYPYIVINDRPKVEALKALYPRVWKA